MNRREILQALAFGPLAMSAACSGPSGPASGGGASSKVLRMIHTQNLASLDPIWTTAPGAKDYGFLTFDQLLAVDLNYKPQPQMAEGYTVENDGRAYVFTLREGLKFHDGEPVRSQDCIPSIKRWGARDGYGQLMMRFVDDFEVIDDRKFRIKLKKPFPLLPDAIGKSGASECFIMPERMAMTPPSEQVKEAIGSGPYKFLMDEWVSGSSAAWAKFDGYVPSPLPASGIAGSRAPVMDRIEWSIITDASTAMAALMSGEKDYWDIPPPDLIATMKADPNLRIGSRNTSGVYYMLQFNHLHAPFDKVGVRQAVAMALDQTEVMKAANPDPSLTRPAYGFYALNTPYATEAGSENLKLKDLEKAKAALKAAGYNGEKLVMLGVQEGAAGNMSQVIEDLFRKMGFNVEYVVVDGATMTQRRTNRESTDKGGWSCFVTGWTGADILNPAVNPMLRGGGEKGFPGWANDPVIEDLKDKWAEAVDPAEQKRLATELQVQAMKTLPYLPLGQSDIQSAYRSNIIGLNPMPVAAYWSVGKSA
jgi:peptide/nickel transport system substrate-binding protein